MSAAARARGRSWEKQVADLFDGIHLGRPHEPDVVTPDFVIECKNEKRTAISAAAIDKARADAASAKWKPRRWLVAKRIKGSPIFIVAMDGEFALELLRGAGLVPALDQVAEHADEPFDSAGDSKDHSKGLHGLA